MSTLKNRVVRLEARSRGDTRCLVFPWTGESESDQIERWQRLHNGAEPSEIVRIELVAMEAAGPD